MSSVFAFPTCWGYFASVCPRLCRQAGGSPGLRAASKQCAANAFIFCFFKQAPKAWFPCQHPHGPFDGCFCFFYDLDLVFLVAANVSCAPKSRRRQCKQLQVVYQASSITKILYFIILLLKDRWRLMIHWREQQREKSRRHYTRRGKELVEKLHSKNWEQ